jgi:hypothetical protein
VKLLGHDQILKIVSGDIIPEDGIYKTFFEEEEDTGWADCTTYRYFFGGEKLPKWMIHTSGSESSFSIRTGKSMFEWCKKEKFLEFVRSNTPDVFDWVLFNLDGL